MTNKLKIFDKQNKIDEFFSKNTKLKKQQDLEVIKNYLEFKNIKSKSIKLSNDYIFEFYDIHSNDAKKLKLRTETIFKLSINQIINKFKKYFEKEIDIDIYFEKANYLEALNENKNKNCCSKHDVEIQIKKKNLNEILLIILEYNEKKYHDEIHDSYKEIKSIFNSNYLKIFEEKNEDTENENLEISIKNFIIDMFCIICMITNDKYVLSKIIYFENIETNDDEELEIKTNIFNYIMQVKQNNLFNLKELFLELRPYDENGSNYKFKDFIKLLEKEYKIDLGEPEIETNRYLVSSLCFQKIIMYMNIDLSDNIREYKDIFMKFLDALENASNKIIEFMNKSYKKYQYTHRYLTNYVLYDLKNNKDISLLREIEKKINKKI